MLRACGPQKRDPPLPQSLTAESTLSLLPPESAPAPLSPYGHTTWLLGSLGTQLWQQSTFGSQLLGQSFKLLPETLAA